MKKVVYQTLEDRNTDPGEVEECGPYPCNWENAWLGDGYYFWEKFIDNAHWWGKEVRAYRNGYIICRAYCELDERCCDLVGNTDHIQMLSDSFDFLKGKGLATNKTTVRRIIEFMRNKTKTFNFEAARVLGIRTKDPSSDFSMNVFFERKLPSYIDLKPPIQICFYRKDSLDLSNYEIIYPDEYSEIEDDELF